MTTGRSEVARQTLSAPRALSAQGAGDRYRCHRCGATFAAWAPAERHADTERHHRLEVILAAGSRPHEPRRNR